MNLMDMAQKVKAMQGEMQKARKQLAGEIVTGEGARGAVRISLDGTLKVKRVEIDPTWLAGGDASAVEQAVAEALRNAVARAQNLAASRMSAFAR